MATNPYPAFAVASEVDQAIARIAEAIIEPSQRADFLFGAGMSIPASFPSGFDLSKILLRQFFPKSAADPVPDDGIKELAASTPLELVAEAVEGAPGKHRDDLTSRLKKIYLDDSKKPTKAHHDLASIAMWEGRAALDRLFTTNFDLLLEKTFDRRAITVFDNNTRVVMDSLREGKIPIIHIHGILDDDYQITERDVINEAYRTTTQLFKNALFEADAFVFVGYSMGDPDFRRVYRNFRDEIEDRKATRGAADKTTYVVNPASSAEAYSLGRAIWDARGAVWIPLDAEAFFGRLRSILADDTGQKRDDAIMAKYGIDRDEYERRLRLLMDLLGIDRSDAVSFMFAARSKLGE
jgi:hypothetical protein